MLSPVPARASAAREDDPARAPWSCRWARVAGTVRTAPTVDSPGVLWTCSYRELSAAPLFTCEECEACRRWCPRMAPVSAASTFAALECAAPASGVGGRRHYARGATIVGEGRQSDVLQTITSGTTKLFTSTPSGRAVGIDVVGPGSPLGVESIIEGSPFRVSVVSLEETTCASVSRRVVLTLLDRRPGLLRAVVSEANEQLVLLMDRIAELAASRVEARLAHVFLALADKFGDRENGKTVVRVALLRQDLADLTGTTLETCIRVMSRWKKQGIVRSQGRGFVIDRKILEMLQQRSSAA